MLQTMKNQIAELKIALLSFMAHELLEEELRRAYDIFTLGESGPSPRRDRGFNEWLIHDYLAGDKDPIVDLYSRHERVDEATLTVFKGSVLSCFKVVVSGETVFFKDLFTRKDYPVETTSLLDDEGVILARLYPWEGQYFFLDEITTFEGAFEPHLLKGVMDKFNQAREFLGYLEIEEFLQRNSFLLYAFGNMVDEILEENLDEPEYTVMESLYQVVEPRKVREVLKSHGQIKGILREEGIYQLIIDGLVIGEIVDRRQQLEMNCNSRELMETGKEWVDEHLKDAVLHLKDTVLHLEDVLEN